MALAASHGGTQLTQQSRVSYGMEMGCKTWRLVSKRVIHYALPEDGQHGDAELRRHARQRRVRRVHLSERHARVYGPAEYNSPRHKTGVGTCIEGFLPDPKRWKGPVESARNITR